MVGKIIKFPVPEKNPEIDFADDFSTAVLSNILGALDRAGYDTKNNDEHMMSMAMFVHEAVKAFYMKSENLYHPMQDLAEELFGEEND